MAMMRSNSRRVSSRRSSRRSGSALRARPTSSRSISAKRSASSKSGASASTTPSGPITREPPQKISDSSTPTRFVNATYEVVSAAVARSRVPQDAAEPSPSSASTLAPRAGPAATLMSSSAPSCARIDGSVGCQKSSQTPMPIPTSPVTEGPPIDARVARIASPAARNRRSSNSPYVGK